MRDVPLETLFRKHLDLPLVLENDAKCAAVGEWFCGAGRGVKDFTVITLGTGIGSGFILNGALYTGGGAGRQNCPGGLRGYVEYLALGVTNLVNLLQPEILAVGGGVSAAPDRLLLEPLREIVEASCYSRHVGKLPRILRAELGNDAGIIGAALLHRAI